MAENNTNIICVEMLENYAMQMQKLLTPKKNEIGLKPKTSKEIEIIWKAVVFLKCYQENQLKELRNIFE